MTTSALILMISVQVSVTLVTVYFFRKVLRAKPKPEPDSFTEND
jgi:hypothetical protein